MRPLKDSLALSKLAACLLLLLVTYDLQLSAQHQQIIPLHQLPQIGGGGGGQFADTCPAGAFLTGLILHAADDVDAIQMLCAGRDGSLKRDMPWHGGTGGRPVALECPRDTPAILAVDVAAEGQKTVVVNNVHIYCGALGPNPSALPNPSAVFDGPPFRRSGAPLAPLVFPALPFMPSVGSLAPVSGAPVRGHQVCPGGEIAVGLHGSSGVWLDAMGLFCMRVSPPAETRPPEPRIPVKTIGRIQIPPSALTPPGTICDAAASARARNSPVTPDLEIQCNKVKAQIVANEKADLAPGPSGVPVSFCDAAQTALDRNALEAVDLSAKCRADGGGQNLTSPADQSAMSGEAMADHDPLLTALRKDLSSAEAIRGFNLGVATCGTQTEWGPGKQKLLDSLPQAEQDGFKLAASFVMDRNRNADLAKAGASIAAQDRAVSNARRLSPDVRYRLGFDIASGIFGNPDQGGQGHTSTGPGSEAIRNSLSAPAQKGFDASVQLHMSRHSF